jgi:hypothetical protein
MIFSVGFSRLNPKPFNIFTCILQLLQPAGRSANPRPNLDLAGHFTALSGYFFPSLDLKPSAQISASSSARVLTL